MKRLILIAVVLLLLGSMGYFATQNSHNVSLNFFGNAFFGLQMKRELRIICLCFFIGKYLHKGTSKNWILINFIEKPFFNQFMSVFAMKF